MVKKKVKKASKRSFKKVVSKSSKIKGRTNERKISTVLKNLVVFLALFILSFALYSVSTSELMVNFFFLIAVLFGFLVLTFFLVLLIFLFMKLLKR